MALEGLTHSREQYFKILRIFEDISEMIKPVVGRKVVGLVIFLRVDELEEVPVGY